MIDNTSVPTTTEYGSSAVWKETPDNTQWVNGVEPEKTLPAPWWNFLMGLFTRSIVNTKTDLTNIVAELKSVLTEVGVTPNGTLTNQVIGAIKTLLTAKTFTGVAKTNPFTGGLTPRWIGDMAVNTTTKELWKANATAGATSSWELLWTADNNGTGSGLDADLVRGTTPGAVGRSYLSIDTQPGMAATILADLKTVDGTGSGLDADLHDGLHAGHVLGTMPISDGVANPFLNSGFCSASGDGSSTAVQLTDYDLNELNANISFHGVSGITHGPESISSNLYGWHYNATAGSPAMQLVWSSGGAPTLFYRVRFYSGGFVWSDWAKLWSGNNDGTGSGLDAGLLCGVDPRVGTSGTYGAKSLARFENWVPPAGKYMFSSPLGAAYDVYGNYATIGIWDGANWQVGDAPFGGGLVESDGNTIVIYGQYACTLYYRKLY